MDISEMAKSRNIKIREIISVGDKPDIPKKLLCWYGRVQRMTWKVTINNKHLDTCGKRRPRRWHDGVETVMRTSHLQVRQ
jgi:hypothetical protein